MSCDGRIISNTNGSINVFRRNNARDLYDDPPSLTNIVFDPTGRRPVSNPPRVSSGRPRNRYSPLTSENNNIPPNINSNSNQPTNIPPSNCESIPDPCPDSFMISRHFRLSDVSSQCAGGARYPVTAQHGLTRNQIICNLKNLCDNILDKMVDKYGRDFLITNAFRPNGAPSGSSRVSQHELGMACDIVFRNLNSEQFYNRVVEISQTFQYDQLILEYNPSRPVRWLHISWLGPHRGNGRPGLPAVGANPKIMTYNDSLKGRAPHNGSGYAFNTLIRYDLPRLS